MRSIGVFSAAGPQTFASQTSSHDGFYAMNRNLSRNLAQGARLPKVGVMQSSQRTQLRSVQPAQGILARTDFGGAQSNVVNDALRRVRSSGACAPKKKGAVPAAKSTQTGSVVSLYISSNQEVSGTLLHKTIQNGVVTLSGFEDNVSKATRVIVISLIGDVSFDIPAWSIGSNKLCMKTSFGSEYTRYLVTVENLENPNALFARTVNDGEGTKLSLTSVGSNQLIVSGFPEDVSFVKKTKLQINQDGIKNLFSDASYNGPGSILINKDAFQGQPIPLFIWVSYYMVNYNLNTYTIRYSTNISSVLIPANPPPFILASSTKLNVFNANITNNVSNTSYSPGKLLNSFFDYDNNAYLYIYKSTSTLQIVGYAIIS